MLRGRLAALRHEAGVRAWLAPKVYLEHIQGEPGPLQEQNRNDRMISEPRPTLVKYVPPAAESDDMQTSDGSEQGQGQAAAAPSQARYVVLTCRRLRMALSPPLVRSPPPKTF